MWLPSVKVYVPVVSCSRVCVFPGGPAVMSSVVMTVPSLRNSTRSFDPCTCHFPMMAALDFFEQDDRPRAAQQLNSATISKAENRLRLKDGLFMGFIPHRTSV
jgi:hypothetical protein